MSTHGCITCTACGRPCPLCGTCKCDKNMTALNFIPIQSSLKMDAIKAKREEIRRKYANEYNQATKLPLPTLDTSLSFYHGQITILNWVIAELENEQRS